MSEKISLDSSDSILLFTARSYGPFFLVMQMENLWMQMEIP